MDRFLLLALCIIAVPLGIAFFISIFLRPRRPFSSSDSSASGYYASSSDSVGSDVVDTDDKPAGFFDWLGGGDSGDSGSDGGGGDGGGGGGGD